LDHNAPLRCPGRPHRASPRKTKEAGDFPALNIAMSLLHIVGITKITRDFADPCLRAGVR